MYTFRCFLLLILSILLLPFLHSQDITGDWYGKTLTEDSARYNLHISRDKNGLKATYDNPDDAWFYAPVDEITIDGDSVFFMINALKTSYKGKVNQDFSSITGEFMGNLSSGLHFGRKKLMKIIQMKDEDLKVVKANTRVVKTGQPVIIPYSGIRKVKAGTPKIIEIDTSQLKIVTPGQDGYTYPQVYTIPETYQEGQHNIRVFNPQIYNTVYRAKQTEPIPVQPMNIKDGALYNIRYLNMEQGLKDPYIWNIIIDSRGNMWFGGYQNGIAKYDGKNLTYYTNYEGLSNNTVWKIDEDNIGNIWICADYGVSKYNGTYFIQYLFGLSGVYTVFESRNGNLWFGTRYEGVLEKRGDNWSQYTKNEGLINNAVRAVAEDEFGNLWFGTEGGACKYNGISFTHFTTKDGFISERVLSIIKDKKGDLWFGTPMGVCKYDGRSFRHYTVNEGLSSNMIFDIKEDEYGNLWFATGGGGVDIYDSESFTHFTVKEGLTNNGILSVTHDRDKNIWLGTEGSGVMKFQRNSFSYFKELEQSGIHKVNSIIEDHDGNILFGCSNGGIIKYDGDYFMILIDDVFSDDNAIRSMVEDQDGNIWFIGNMLELKKYDGNAITVYENIEIWNRVYGECLFQDKIGNFWIGTLGEGLKKFDGTLFTAFPILSYHPYYNVTSVLQDHQGNIWFGSNFIGLFRYDGDLITQYNYNEGLSGKSVTVLYEDRSGNLWIGTQDGGINKYDGHSFTFITENEGLCNNSVTSIIEDNKGNIWVGTIYGLSMLQPQGNKSYSVISFGTEDGLKNLTFNKNSVCLDSRNRIWWGTGDQVTMLDLNTYKINTKPPEIQLNHILINEEWIDFGFLLTGIDITEKKPFDTVPVKNLHGIKFSDVAPFYNYPVGLKLHHNLDHLTFDFSAIDWTAPQSIRYQYILEGQDDQWNALSKENIADYRNILPGKYTFKVKALSRANAWSETLEYPFTVRWPWWFRWWSIAFYSLVLILLLRYYIGYILSRERIRAEVKLKQVEVEKMHEMDRMKSRFFANISHEFRTPLTLILGPVEDLFTRKPERAELSWDIMKVIRRNAIRLQKLINQLLDIARLETGEVRLNVSEGDLEEFVRTIILSFLSLAESKNIKYEYKLPEASSRVYFDSDKVEKILTNLIYNAFKFTSAQGKIKVSFQYLVSGDAETPEFAEIKVSDTGRGIPQDKIDRIFDRFYQVSDGDTRDAEGTGIGLALTRELVELYRGEIKVESEVNKGSVFTLKLPVSKELFKENEITEVSPDDRVIKMAVETDVIAEEPEESGTGEGEIREGPGEVEEKEVPVILIVEDNIDLRNYISRNLGDGYQIMMAENGKAGLESAIQSIPDLVVSDLMMPVMDGMEMCRLLKTDERTSHIPVIMLTARADRGSKLEGLETGADDYIIKPFDAEELKVRVRNLIEQRKKLREKFSKQFLGQEKGPVIESYADQWMKKLFQIIEQRYTDYDFSVNEMGRELNLSRAQFFRKVHALTGNTPNELLRLYRIKKAATMIESGEDNITRIMYEVGFQSTSHFAKSFRKYYGKNPSEYRDSLGR
jgi:signal transduction histidine kinase/ligand-binding sensor domain-containing protein/DNA-binding response OmpR family regulator